MAILKTMTNAANAVQVFLRETASGSVDVVVKGTVGGRTKQARVIRILSRNNKAAKRGTITFGRKGSSLRALGLQTVKGRVAFAA